MTPHEMSAWGALILYILYKEGLERLLSRKNEKSAGNIGSASNGSSPSSAVRAAVIEIFDLAFKPIIENQTHILQEIASTQHEIATGMTRLLDRVP